MRETLELALHTYPHPLHFTDEETEAQSGTMLMQTCPLHRHYWWTPPTPPPTPSSLHYRGGKSCALAWKLQVFRC